MNSLKLNQKLKIVPKNIGNALAGTICELSEDGFTVILDKMDSKIKKELVDITVSDENYLLNFSLKIDKIDENKLYFKNPRDIKVVQRRQYPRVEADLPVNIIDSAEGTVEGKITNISGGGLQLDAPKKFLIGSIINTEFKLFTQKTIKTAVEILRVNINQQKTFLSGMFKSISNTDKIAIIQMCFKKQIESKQLRDFSTQKNDNREDKK
ncbi:MAG: PilZ domain-containing protein [Candidatus Gastranaerophilales bacterium]|nr:PilZ domain-containing protein [Candidatus Gastranaerophilales bacterium]